MAIYYVDNPERKSTTSYGAGSLKAKYPSANTSIIKVKMQLKSITNYE